ncbi:hypothetical protein NN561_013970 [Cricetulus griseus]
MTGPGGGAVLRVRALHPIRVWSSSPALLLLCLCTVRLVTRLGTRVGPAFVYRPRHWTRGTLSGRATAACPFESEVDGCLQVTSPPRVIGPKLQGKDPTLRLRTSPAPLTQIFCIQRL